jgi:hypothetical protein
VVAPVLIAVVEVEELAFSYVLGRESGHHQFVRRVALKLVVGDRHYFEFGVRPVWEGGLVDGCQPPRS